MGTVPPLALLADVHANVHALEACLDHARAQGAERFAFLGDIVGYGADPAAVIAIVAAHRARGAIVVKGNHDEAVSGSGSGYMNESARACIAWTREILTAAQREFLGALPLCVRAGDECFVHASAASPEKWTYIDGREAARRSIEASEAPRTYSGHVHEQRLFALDARGHAGGAEPRPGRFVPMPHNRRWLVLPGSVGQPRDGNTAAAYALVSAEGVAFHRIAYDNRAAAESVRRAGLPQALAFRLERGA